MADDVTHLNAALEGRYRIERELGEGGMATVYLAHDLRHVRKIALKVLKPELAAVVGADRFLAEIKTTANLQHPHILPLFDSGEADGILFYVMPYVEGESLRQRLDRERQLPMDDAVRVATGVAEALDYAHSHGVIHRDIKPANILLSKGQPVVSDFGIALALSAGGGGRLTETGLSLGTPQYMSPEQATGDLGVGPTADIHALGCVLYEMLAGEPPYAGATPQAVLGKIIVGDVPSLSEQRPSVPPNVEATVLRALEKVPADRFRNGEEFAQALADRTYRHRSSPHELDTVPSRWKRMAAAGWGTVLVLCGVLTWSLGRRPDGLADPLPTFSSLAPFEMRAPAGSNRRLAISPDGGRIAISTVVDGADRLYWRPANSTQFTELPGVVGNHPSFSPDGEQLMFTNDDGRHRVDLATGSVTRLGPGQYSHWGLNGQIVYWEDGALYLSAPGSGGERLILDTDTAAGRPHLLPSGKAVVYQSGLDFQTRRLRMVEVGTEMSVDLGLFGSNPLYIPTGHLVYGDTEQRLMAVPFDEDRLELTGDPFMVLPEVLVYPGGATQFAVSETGTAIVGLPSDEASLVRELVVVSPEGAQTTLPVKGNLRAPRLSPSDGRYVAYERDLVIRVFDQVTGADWTIQPAAPSHSPSWSRDGTRLYYSMFTGAGWHLAVSTIESGGLTPAETLVPWLMEARLLSPGADGTVGLAEMWRMDRGVDLLTVDLTQLEVGDYLRGNWNEYGGALSPSGHHVAYISDESGRPGVYVRTFPDPGEPVSVFAEDGDEAVWDPEGGAVYFRAGGGIMRAVVNVQGTALETGRVRRVLDDRWSVAASLPGTRASVRNWDVHPNGDRFLFVSATEDNENSPPPTPIEMITHFFALLEELDPN